MNHKTLKINEILPNEGQIEGVPKNPRFIRDTRFETLKRSIKDAPEMLEYRTLGVYPHAGKYVAICGNMRLRACKELGHTEVPCYIFPAGTPAEKLREYAMKDNLELGQPDWDALANEWSTEELQRWGVEVIDVGTSDIDALFEEAQNHADKPKNAKLEVIIPGSLSEQKDEIADAIRAAVDGYKGVKVKEK